MEVLEQMSKIYEALTVRTSSIWSSSFKCLICSCSWLYA